MTSSVEWRISVAMTGNRFAGEVCVYCNMRPSVQDDHILARKFFVVPQRGNLPQAPACAECNGAKGAIESALMPVLAFGGRHADALENLVTQVPRRLHKNRRVARHIYGGTSYPLIVEKGILRRGMAIPFDIQQLEALFVYVAKGLAWHHLDELRFGSEHFVKSHAMIGTVGHGIRRLLNYRAGYRIEADLGNGTFHYVGAQSGSNSHITVWEFATYGGLRTELGGDVPCNIGVITGPAHRWQRNAERARLLGLWRSGQRLADQ